MHSSIPLSSWLLLDINQLSVAKNQEQQTDPSDGTLNDLLNAKITFKCKKTLALNMTGSWLSHMNQFLVVSDKTATSHLSLSLSDWLPSPCKYIAKALFNSGTVFFFFFFFFFKFWLLHPLLPTLTKLLYISASKSYSKCSSRTPADFLPICMKTMTVAVKQGQRGPDNMGLKQTLPNQNEMNTFLEKKNCKRHYLKQGLHIGKTVLSSFC